MKITKPSQGLSKNQFVPFSEKYRNEITPISGVRKITELIHTTLSQPACFEGYFFEVMLGRRLESNIF